MHDTLVKTLTDQYTSGLNSIADAMNYLANGFNGTVFDTQAQTVSAIVKPTAMIILSILCMVGIIDEVTRKGEEMRWEDVVRILIKLLICKNLMEIAPMLMSVMYNSVTKLVTEVAGTAFTAEQITATVTALKMNELIPADKSGVIEGIKAMASQLGAFISLYVPALFFTLSSMVTKVMVFMLMFELSVITALSPIPIAFAGWSETKDVPKKFLMGYFGTSLQALAMTICFVIFINLFTGVASSGDGWKLLQIDLALAISLFTSGKWAKDSLGLG